MVEHIFHCIQADHAQSQSINSVIHTSLTAFSETVASLKLHNTEKFLSLYCPPFRTKLEALNIVISLKMAIVAEGKIVTFLFPSEA